MKALTNDGNKAAQFCSIVFKIDHVIIRSDRQAFAAVSTIPGNRVAVGMEYLLAVARKNVDGTMGIIA